MFIKETQKKRKIWQKNKEKKIDKLKELNEDKDLDECTFKPHMFKMKSQYSSIMESEIPKAYGIETCMKSVDKYIEKRKSMMEQKEEEKKQYDNRIGSGSNWKHKITVPDPPCFLARNIKFNV